MFRTIRSVAIVTLALSLGLAANATPTAPAVIPSLASVANISALSALGSAGGTTSAVSVAYYATPGDDGGGLFLWEPANVAAPDRCTIFAANGVASGRWVRQLGGIPFNVDMCGTGTKDDSPAFQAAYAVCAAQNMHLSLSAKRYYIRATLTPPPGCAWDGAGSMGFGTGVTPTVLDYSHAPPSVTQAMNVVGGAYGTYGSVLPFGHFSISGYGSKLTRGLYVSRLLGIQVEDVTVQYIPGGGPCFFFGQSQQSTVNFLFAYGCGSPTSGEIVFDGEQVGTTEYVTTTMAAFNLYAEYDAGNKAVCGITIDRQLAFSLNGGDAEASGTPYCIGTKPAKTGAVLGVTISNVDMEGPSNGSSHCIIVGTGWSGAPGTGDDDVTFNNFVCQAITTQLTSAVLVQNSINFRATSGYTQFTGNGGTLFDFEGTNANAVIDSQTVTPGETYNLVQVNGAVVPGANPDTVWYMAAMPGPVAQLKACSTSYLGVRRIVTDATQTLAAGIGTVVSGGGSNTVAVGCDGTNWRIGG